ncbi:MAG: carboxymuconolactone decarboxylase family protein [Calditrichaceae bacterium]
MDHENLPEKYRLLKENRKNYIKAMETLGEAVRKEGPIDEKTTHLIQLAGAATLRSEGAVHSHARRALEAGATPEEIYHAVILLTPTIGFPNVAAALSWVDDVIEK